MAWVFQESDPMGGAAGEAYANTLKSPGMHPEHVLAREAIQNSVDAGLEGEKVLVRFRHRELTGKEKEAFIEAAGLSDIAERADKLELAGPNCLAKLGKPKEKLSLLYVEDFNAEGLSGDPHDKGSNFFRLLLSLGDRSKARNSKGTGGSYGFGKSVYSSGSAIQTIFAYTRFEGEEGEKTRIFGCGYYASHEHKGKSFSGRAWLGVKQKSDAAGRTVVDPLEGKAADSLAERLGFELRREGDLGTSILIVDAAVDLQEIVRGVEDWWWPRLVEHQLDVEVIDAEGNEFVPRPKKNDQLKPFIEAFEIARGRAEPKSGEQKFNRLNNLRELQLGTAGFVVAPLQPDGSAPVVRSDRCNSVALIRGPLMVVAYHKVSETAPIVVGAYMAPDEEAVELALKRSEPPAHDRWDPDSANLRDEKGAAKEVVAAVLSRIKAGLKRFQSEAAPPAPPKQRRLSLLERALGAYFKPSGAGPGGVPPAGSSLLHLEFTKQPAAEATTDGKLRLRADFAVTLDGKAEEEVVALEMTLRSPVLEDEDTEGEDLKLDVKWKGVEVTRDDQDERIYRFKLAKGGKAEFSVESEPYDPAWTVRLRPEIEEAA